ncbi:hypothetical protein ACJX0J_027553 [Zea mays]
MDAKFLLLALESGTGMWDCHNQMKEAEDPDRPHHFGQGLEGSELASDNIFEDTFWPSRFFLHEGWFSTRATGPSGGADAACLKASVLDFSSPNTELIVALLPTPVFPRTSMTRYFQIYRAHTYQFMYVTTI